ncbi:MAG: histidine kinase [Chitinophagaceae bacterium]|nr:histidine kinase [Chitinophagaceae bacterium]
MKKTSTILLAGLLFVTRVLSQAVSFSHLNTTTGLSDNLVRCAITDQNGFLWIGTANGLNRYDGHTVTTYYKSQQPQLCSNNIFGIFCDSRNRIWVGSYSGVTMIDEYRRFHTIIFNDSIKTNYSCAVIIESPGLGIIMYTSEGHYCFDEKKGKWYPLTWSTTEQFKIGWRDNSRFDSEKYIQTGYDKLIILDYASQRKSFEFDVPNAISSCRINDDEILVAAFEGKLVRVSIRQKKIIKEYPLTKMQNGKLVNTSIIRLRQAATGKIIITTGVGGLFVFDPVSERFSQYKHHPLDPGSLSDNANENIFCDANGNVFICGSNNGLDYFNIKHYSPVHISLFTGPGGEIYDGRVNCIEKDRKGRLWLGGRDCLVMYDPLSGKSAIYRYFYPILNIGERSFEINCIGIDNRDQIWVGTNGGGMGMLNEATGQFIKFSVDSLDGKKPGFVSNVIFNITAGNNDMIWVGCSVGAVLFNTTTFKTDTLRPSIFVDKGKDKAVIRIFKDSRGKMWLGTWNNGIYCYDPEHATLNEVKYPGTKKASFVTDFAEDKNGKIYAATSEGIAWIDERGKEVLLSGENGQEYKNCSALLLGNNDQFWFSSNRKLFTLTASTKTFRSFDEKIAQRTYGFNAGAIAFSDSLQYWASEKGIIFFNPDKLRTTRTVLNPIVYGVTTTDSSYSFAGSNLIKLPYKSNTLSFSFTTIDLYGGENIIYQYRLSNQDNEWINSAGIRQVRYNSLRPGKYSFQVRASADGINWSSLSNTITVRIRPALWQTWWFRTLGVLLIAGLVFYFFRRRVAVIKEREKIRSQYEQKIAEVEMASLRAQMNPHFMFNSLNSINNFILKNDPDNASGYLTKFSRLMRLILDNSRSEWVLLENELKALELYIQLEAVRFDHAFSYSIEVVHDINIETVIVPPLLIQPYVENAIWHGLLHRKEPGGRLDIKLWKNDGTLYIEIEDNGVGRDEAKRLRSKTATKQKSHGMKITAERMEIVNKVYNVNAGVTITDLDIEKDRSGTRVLITLKYKTHDSHYSG